MCEGIKYSSIFIGLSGSFTTLVVALVNTYDKESSVASFS